MSNITVENLSIKFRIYHDHSPSLKDYFSTLLKRKNKASYSDFWAVKDVSFRIQAGDRVGIVGHNGAGKSTLLKALCNVYEPSDGRLVVNGKIAPLLEIGAGFHPEFTGRENIYLNGAILGYSKQQLRGIESEVIAFSELEEFIDTAVKYYSTGMYMRLAFSLATAIHPDILILDEVFASGDAAFITKARVRMQALIDKANIMIMVSHDHQLIHSLCNRVIWLDHGKLVADGDPRTIIDRYLTQNNLGNLPKDSISIEECEEQKLPSRALAWMPSREPNYPLDPEPIVRFIEPPKTTLVSKIFGKQKKWLGKLYQNYLKQYAFLQRVKIWVQRKRIRSHVFKNVFNKWQPIVKLSLCSKYSLGSRCIIAEKSVVTTTVLSVFPTTASSYLALPQDRFLFPEIFVTTVDQAKIYGGTNLILTQDKVLCHDLYDFDRDYTSEELHGRVMIDPKHNRIRWKSHDSQPESIPIAGSFVDSCALNYAHWLTEVLPRICLFCADKRFDGIPIIVNYGLHPNLMASLFLIVGTEREIIVLPIGRAVAVDRMYYMSPTGYIPFERRPSNLVGHSDGVFSPYALNILRERLMSHAMLGEGSNFPKKIYLRRSSSIRQLINEAEVEAVLVNKGFSIIEAEHLTFTQQMVLFQHAEVVIGSTGAACANIIFSRPATHVAILMAIHKNMPYRYWAHMSNAAGVKKISYILGSIVQNSGLDFHGDYQIQIADLLSYLKILENK